MQRGWVMFLFILWEFHTKYFDHILPFLPTILQIVPYLTDLPTSCSFFLLKREKKAYKKKKSHTKPPFLKATTKIPTRSLFCIDHLLLSMRPALCSVTPLNKTGFPPSSRYQLQNSFLVKRWDCVLTSLSPVCWGVHLCAVCAWAGNWPRSFASIHLSSLQCVLSEDNSANIVLLFA